MGISANELVMRAREHVYHIGCFTCASCSKALTTGDYFGMKDHLIYCRTHYELLIQGAYLGSPGPMPQGGMSPCLSPGPPGPPPMPYYNGVGTTTKGRPRKRKSPMPDSDPCLALGKYLYNIDCNLTELWYRRLVHLGLSHPCHSRPIKRISKTWHLFFLSFFRRLLNLLL